MKKMIFGTVMSLIAMPAMAQMTNIAAVLGEAQALEQINEFCPGLYPDMNVIEASEERAWQYAVSQYGEQSAQQLFASDALMEQIDKQSYATLIEFTNKAGGPEKLCDYLASGRVIGITKTSPDNQPEGDEPNPSPISPNFETGPTNDTPALPGLVPYY